MMKLLPLKFVLTGLSVARYTAPGAVARLFVRTTVATTVFL